MKKEGLTMKKHPARLFALLLTICLLLSGCSQTTGVLPPVSGEGGTFWGGSEAESTNEAREPGGTLTLPHGSESEAPAPTETTAAEEPSAADGTTSAPDETTTEDATTEASTSAPESTTPDEPGSVYEYLEKMLPDLSAKINLDFITSDVSDYPNVRLYFRVTDNAGDSVLLSSPTAGILESVGGGEMIEREIRKIERLEGNEGIGFDLLIDKSGSMDQDLPRMQQILREFIQNMDSAAGDAAELISFDSYIMYMCTYTNDPDLLTNGIDNMTPYGSTALYDALYTGVMNAGNRPGANCVIGFTDGMDNESVYTPDEVVNLALAKEIPLYLIGTAGADSATLRDMASRTGGFYWSVNDINDVSDVLNEVYRDQKDMYCIEYVSDPNEDPYADRNISCILADDTYGGQIEDFGFKPIERKEEEKHDSRYEIFAADLSWTEANNEALSRGGHLVTITTQEEMDLMVEMAEKAGLKYIWIGGYTSVRGSDIFGHWITGEPFEYTAWYPGEPSRNDLDGTPEFYLMLWKVGEEWSWNDQREDVVNDPALPYFKGNIGYICEYED